MNMAVWLFCTVEYIWFPIQYTQPSKGNLNLKILQYTLIRMGKFQENKTKDWALVHERGLGL